MQGQNKGRENKRRTLPKKENKEVLSTEEDSSFPARVSKNEDLFPRNEPCRAIPRRAGAVWPVAGVA